MLFPGDDGLEQTCHGDEPLEVEGQSWLFGKQGHQKTMCSKFNHGIDR